MRSTSILSTLLIGLGCADAFVSPSPRSACLVGNDKNIRVVPTSSSLIGMSAFDGIKGPVQSYVDIWTPMFRQASESGLVPDFLLHWGHGAAMTSVLLSMGVIGAYMGWQIRLGNGEDVTPLTLGDTIREAHPKIIGGAFFFFLLGGQGGLVLLDTQGKSILESPHAITAALSVALLTAQALLPKLFATENGALARDVHAYLGTATMAVLFAHLATGVNLGLSF
ncbi:hypothetical protein ACHAXA_001227 [Cyclostephanos tholiformis]|uniref:Uncharacterized protein n=1 Tax=Cyclostephanos tholiformis TaxID=382380 RepID=A0ABD3R6T6_9STRA